MWQIAEHRDLKKILPRLPKAVAEKYQIWKDLVMVYGPEKLREFPGFHDEKLKGERSGERSSRLSQQYRVIYVVERQAVSVFVIDITPHKY